MRRPPLCIRDLAMTWWEANCWPANECPEALRHLSAHSKQTCAHCGLRFRPSEHRWSALLPEVGWAHSQGCARWALYDHEEEAPQ